MGQPQTLNRSPVLPRSEKNPAGGTRQVAQAKKAFDLGLARLKKQLFLVLDGLPSEELAPIRVNKKYYYMIDPEQLLQTATNLFEQAMGGVGKAYTDQAQAAYRGGAATAESSLRTLLDDTSTFTKPLQGVPFIQRIAYVKARVFEEMKGFLGDTASRLGVVLLEELADGNSIAAIKSRLIEEFSIASSRAETIARTEVIGALRRGRIEQTEVTAAELGVDVGLMWYSALSPTTRQSHAERHGKVYSPDEVRDFYTEDGNGINCKCAQVEVILKKDGTPLQQKLVAREADRRKNFLKEEADE